MGAAACGLRNGIRACIVAGVLARLAAPSASQGSTWTRIALAGCESGARSAYHGVATARGLLYAFGGLSPGSVLSSELVTIDPRSGTCTTLDAGAGVSGGPPSARYSVGMDAWGELLYLFGGIGSNNVYLNDLWHFDTVRLVWKRLDGAAGVNGTVPSARADAAVAAHNGVLFVTFGWCDGCGNLLSDAHRYDIATMQWTALASAKGSARLSHCLAALGTTLFALGGRGESGLRVDMLTLEVGNATAPWTTQSISGAPSLVPAARRGAALADVGGRLVLFGGLNSEASPSRYYNDMHMLRPGNFSWDVVSSATDPVPAGRAFFGRAAVIGCSVYVKGGLLADNEFSDELWQFQVNPDKTGSCNCPPGLSGPDGGICSPCPAGSFKNVSGSTKCLQAQCPANSGPPPGSATAACLCNAGYTGPDGGNCVACPKGSFKTLPGAAACTNCSSGKYSATLAANSSNVCIDCPVHSNSEAGSPTFAACECKPGYSGPNGGDCVSCPAGRFKNVSGSSNCTLASCPANSMIPSGSASALCMCSSGFTRGQTGACVACASGSFKPSVGFDECTRCPLHSVSPTGSSSLANCSCVAGYTGPDGGACTQCPAGLFKSSTGSTTCAPCPRNTFSAIGASACAVCPAGTQASEGKAVCCADANAQGSDGGSDCVCNAGYTPLDTASGSVTCAPCSAGKFKSVPGSEACSLCTSNTYSAATGAKTSSTCAACPTGTNAPEGRSVCCEDANAQGSADGGPDCLCNAGFSGKGGGACVACAAGSFKPSLGEAPCTICGSGKYSTSTAATNSSLCTDCPVNATSASGSSSCTCKRGYSAGAAGACLACPVGSYKPSEGVAACTVCNAGKYSITEGSDAETNCLACAAGKYSINPGAKTLDSCVACAAGKFSTAIGASSQQACQDCRAGKYSTTEGSDKESGCISCDAGTFSTETGADSRTKCLPSPSQSSLPATFVVKLVVSLPMTASEFATQEQTAFKMSVAAAAQVSSQDVIIGQVASVSIGARRQQEQSIRVEVEVKVTDLATANSVAARLSAPRINSELTKVGLPPVTVIESARVVAVPPSETSSSGKYWGLSLAAVIIGCVVAGLVVCAGIASLLRPRSRWPAAAAALSRAPQEAGAAPVEPNQGQNLPGVIEISLSPRTRVPDPPRGAAGDNDLEANAQGRSK